MSKGIIIQARNNSSRLPNKLCLPFHHGVGILEILIGNITSTISSVPVVLATTTHGGDDKLVKIADKMGIDVFRGSESNVLDRFIQTAAAYSFEKVIRVCSDNPFLDVGALDFLLGQMEETDHDYWCYSGEDNLPSILTHYGFWAEGLSVKALQKVSSITTENLYLEHVTSYIYTHPDQFDIKYIRIDPYIDQERSIRLTVDTKNDFEVAKLIYESSIADGISHDSRSLVKYIKQHPEWIQIMQNEILSNAK
jgi:spore coat polysaccharide biosynthesis protein SpsF